MLKFAGLALALSLIWLQDAETPPPAGVVPGSSSPPETAVPPPEPLPDPGAELTLARCTSCHESARFTSQHRTPEQWGETVQRMISYGARVSPEEAPEIVAYLARAHGPEVAEEAETASSQ